MENSNDNLIFNPYFKILYPNQKFKNSAEFKRWKKSITENIGDNGIEMYCNKDKIIIYEDMNEILKCPICNEKYYYCPYCKRAEKKKTCCVRGIMKDIINRGSNIYINIDNEEKRKEFIQTLLITLIPLIFNFSLLFDIFIVCYLGLIKNDIYLDDKIANGKQNFCRKLLIVGFIFVMSLIYMIFFYNLFLFTIIFSIPFKLYPIKYCLGILDAIDF